MIVYSAIYPLMFLLTVIPKPPIKSITLPLLLLALSTKNPNVLDALLKSPVNVPPLEMVN